MGRAADRLIREDGAPEQRLSSRVVALIGLGLGALVAASPAALFHIREPLWRSAVPFGAWALVVTFLFSRRVAPDPAGALRLLRVGGAGLLLLLALAAPPILARRESGARLFAPAMGREVLAWGAWRTAWMAGYFYNDGKVRAVEQASEIFEAIEAGEALVLAGPSERRRLEAMGSLEVRVLAEGPRENASDCSFARSPLRPHPIERCGRRISRAPVKALLRAFQGRPSAGLSLERTAAGMRPCRWPFGARPVRAPQGASTPRSPSDPIENYPACSSG